MTGLHLAAYFGVDDAVRTLLDISSPDSKDSYSRTPLSRAALSGHEGVVQLLLDNSADIGIENRSGWTALQIAAFSGHEGAERLLVTHGGPDPEDFYGLEKLFS
jgi:ankyrin repeat protein